MKFSNAKDVKDFLKVVDKCDGEVYLKSQYGDVFNLKSKLSQYVAVAALLGEHGDELELFAQLREDETLLFQFLNSHSGVAESPFLK